MRKGIKITTISRRRFTGQLGMLGSVMMLPIYGCAEWFRGKQKLTLGDDEKRLLYHVLAHLFPSSGTAPGAEDINSTRFVSWVLSDKKLKPSRRRLLLSGIGWTEQTAQEMYKRPFVKLDSQEKEQVLRDLEGYSNGQTWLAYMLRYTFEALLGDPVYGINVNQVGWKWLGHRHGVPRPTEDKIYGKL
jgi:hypothetical protein